MEINEFIQETITQIVQGVAITNETFAAQGAYVASKDVQGGNVVYRREGNIMKSVVMVDFDIAVTVSQKDDKNKGIGASLKVASFGFDADFSKGASNVNQQTSRVKFSLPLVLNDDMKQQGTRTRSGVRYN